jgi:hypothetical protein
MMKEDHPLKDCDLHDILKTKQVMKSKIKKLEYNTIAKDVQIRKVLFS